MTSRVQPKIPSMTIASFVRLIFLKDIRRLRLQLMLMLGLAVALILCAHPGGMEKAVPVAIILQLLCLGVIIQVILNDPAGRDFRFLLTRPVPGMAVLIAKVLFFTVFIVIPTCVIHELIVVRFGSLFCRWITC